MRCPWAEQSELDKMYHDTIWGKENHDERQLFRMLMLEGLQAGLSWSIILKKEKDLDIAFDNFDPHILMHYDEKKIEELLQNPKIIRHRGKINAIINNAKAYFKLCEEFESLDYYIWSYVNFKQIKNHWTYMEEVPANTALSDTISKDLKKRGFKFVGSTIIYSYLQAIGVINDHLTACECY